MNIREQLRRELPNLPRKMALAARYALDNPERIALQSMRSSAGLAGVTSTTMLRLARRLGFENYEAYRAGFQSELIAQGFGARAGALQDNVIQSGDEPLIERINLQAQRNIGSAAKALQLGQLCKIADILRRAPAVYLVGSGSMFSMAAMMHSTGTMILPNLKLVSAEFAVAAEAMGSMSQRDAVIGFGINPCSRRTIAAFEYANARKARTIAITDRPSSPIAERSDFVLCAGTESSHYYPSTIALAFVVEALLAAIVAEGDGSEIARIEEFEALRNNSDAYLVY